jgi:hypothetical protein
MTPKSLWFFFNHFLIKFSGSQTFFDKLLASFSQKISTFMYKDKALLAQLFPIAEFYHSLKFLQNLQSYPVYMTINIGILHDKER